MKELYWDCSMGAAGDMLAASLWELCPDGEAALTGLNALGIPGICYEAETVVHNGIRGTHFKVSFHGEEESPETARHGGHHHSLADVLDLIDSLPLSDKVSGDAKAVYRMLAAAEASVHGQEMENIHFHELGTMDAVADVTAVCWLMAQLAPERVVAAPVRTGFGTVCCAHGLMPVPAPATALLLEGIPVFPGEIEGEMCTPTGAALLKYFVTAFEPMPPMTVGAVGYGMGKKRFERPNCVRAFLGESGEDVVELCCNVDDMSPENIGFALEELLRAGALDAWYEPIGMKKTRPGLLLTCLCRSERRDAMVELIFRHTTSIGVRETLCRRYVLQRGTERVETPYGEIRVKRSYGYGVERRKAEYDDLARICRDSGLSMEEVRGMVNGSD